METAAFAPDARVRIEAPAVELVLFDTAAQLVKETGVNRKDAFHFVFATWEHVDTIVTTDKEFIDRSAKKYPKLPKVERPSDVERFTKAFGESHKAMFGS